MWITLSTEYIDIFIDFYYLGLLQKKMQNKFSLQMREICWPFTVPLFVLPDCNVVTWDCYDLRELQLQWIHI